MIPSFSFILNSFNRFVLHRPGGRIFQAICLLSFLPAGATDFLIDGTTRLNTISVPNTGAHHIRFTGAGYQNPGSLTLNNNASDSLIFERNAPTDSAIRVDATLLHLQGQKGTVVFRGLSFKLNTGGAVFDTNQSGNHHLVFDSCLVLGDTVTKGKVFSWSGDGASNITLSNSMFASTGALSLTGASNITLSNNLFNFSGVLTASTTTQFVMKYNTVNRTQFLLDGNFSARCTIQNNYFANPPVKNNLAQGGNQKFIVFFKGNSFLSTGSNLSDNIRYSTWDGYDFYPPGIATFTDPSNTTVTPSKDSTIVWDWKTPGDATHGAWNGTTPLPTFNIFPSDSTVSLSVPGGNAVFNLNRSAFPRVIGAAYGTAAYATALPDSARSWFERDTTLVLTGSATVQSITLPARLEGTPILFSKSGVAFTPGSMGSEGGTTFVNSTLTSNAFIPAFAGQNTFRGSNTAVKSLSSDSVFIFSSIARSGRTAFSKVSLVPLNKRWRVIQKAGSALGIRGTTTAQGSGTASFGLSKIGADAPFKADSLAWWLGGNAFATPSDSVGKYWGRTAFSPSMQAMLIERLAIGQGRDTLSIPQGRLITSSVSGHQLSMDSTFVPTLVQFPEMGNFSKGLSLGWAGRAVGDSLYVELKKSAAKQRAFLFSVGKAIELPSLRDDSVTITLAIGMADSGKVFFLASDNKQASIYPADRTHGLPLPVYFSVAGHRLLWGSDALSGRILLADSRGKIQVDAAVSRTATSFSLASGSVGFLYGYWMVSTNGGGQRNSAFSIGQTP